MTVVPHSYVLSAWFCFDWCNQNRIFHNSLKDDRYVPPLHSLSPADQLNSSDFLLFFLDAFELCNLKGLFFILNSTSVFALDSGLSYEWSTLFSFLDYTLNKSSLIGGFISSFTFYRLNTMQCKLDGLHLAAVRVRKVQCGQTVVCCLFIWSQ